MAVAVAVEEEEVEMKGVVGGMAMDGSLRTSGHGRICRTAVATDTAGFYASIGGDARTTVGGRAKPGAGAGRSLHAGIRCNGEEYHSVDGVGVVRTPYEDS